MAMSEKANELLFGSGMEDDIRYGIYVGKDSRKRVAIVSEKGGNLILTVDQARTVAEELRGMIDLLEMK